jgi:hypothetical protein
LPVAIYTYETWSLALSVREDDPVSGVRQRGAEEKGGRKVQRKLRNEELHDLYSTPEITGVVKSRRMR